MNEEEINKNLIENFIKSNPFDFKQGIISHCRQMDKLDVYEWVAEDELKIMNLQQENNRLKETYKDAKMVLGQNHRLKEEINKLKDRIEKAIELLEQPTPTYASCIKLLDEIEIKLKGEENNNLQN